MKNEIQSIFIFLLQIMFKLNTSNIIITICCPSTKRIKDDNTRGDDSIEQNKTLVTKSQNYFTCLYAPCKTNLSFFSHLFFFPFNSSFSVFHGLNIFKIVHFKLKETASGLISYIGPTVGQITGAGVPSEASQAVLGGQGPAWWQ